LVGGAAWCGVAWWESRERRWLVLASLLAASSFLLKKDVALACATAAAAGVLVRAPRPGWVPALAGAGLVALALVLGRRAGAPIPEPYFEEDYLRALREGSPALWLARVPLILESGWKALERAHMALWWSAVFLVAVPLGLRAGGWRRFLALWLVLYLGALLLVFVVTPDQAAWHVRTASTRLLCHLALPAGLLLVDLGLRTAERVQRELYISPQ
jgi:hypothetical protein